ncbi:hypothetical protein Bbelb_116800 [Branchiostoma belcheri]|nr:hypothetical protein Bbelb_116800 [Branchiostoma belcheri]
MKEYTDQKRNARPSNLRVGDTVLVQQTRQNTLTAAYDHQPYLITHKKGTLVTANRDGKETTRHTTMFKKIPTTIPRGTGADTRADQRQQTTKTTNSDYITRSGRTVKPPDRLNL